MFRAGVSRIYLGLIIATIAMLIAACGGSDPTATATTAPVATAEPTATPDESPEAQWQALIEAAQAEGTVNVMAGGSASRSFRPVIAAFEEKFGIEVSLSTGSSSANVDRVLAERSAGKFTEDVALAGGRSAARLVTANALLPVLPLLILPEVTNTDLWYEGHHWYSDKEQQFMLSYAAKVVNPPMSIAYNKSRVNPDDITSVWDLLDPKWSIISAPPTFASGQTGYFELWIHPDIGPEWVKQFVLADHVTFSIDTRTSVDGLSFGKYDLAVLGANVTSEVEELDDQGVDLGIEIMTKALKEGGRLSGTGSSRNVEAMADAPHPNAAKLFINWLLSKEGQTVIHTKADGKPSQSLRVDVADMGKVRSSDQRVEGTTYTFASADPELIAQINGVVNGIVDIYQTR
jgi:ABC-type Fe3+ transport system substrate-binding protein